MLRIKQKNAGDRSEWLVKKRYTFGTDAQDNYRVGGDVAPSQAALSVDGDTVTLANLVGQDNVTVNGERLAGQRRLIAGDEFTVGEGIFVVEDPKQSRLKAAAADQPYVSGWSMRAKNTALENRLISLDGVQKIGRAQDCDIYLNVVHLSRYHAVLKTSDNSLFVEDLQSANGTFLNGKRISKAKVNSGDELTFDTLRFTVLGPKAELERTLEHGSFTDSNATTVRPALTAQQLSNAKLSNAKRADKPAVKASAPNAPRKKPTDDGAGDTPAKPFSQNARTRTLYATKPLDPGTGSAQQNKSGSGVKTMMLLLMLAAIGGGSYYYFTYMT